MRLNPFKAATNVSSIFKSILSFNTILNEKPVDPHLLQNLFKMDEALEGTPHGERSTKFQLQNANMRKLYEENWQPERLDLNKLKKLPSGSLGKVYADNLIRQGFTPDELLDLDPHPINSEREFLCHRQWQVHDLAHTILGFNTSVEGEIGVQAFMFAQTQAPTHLFIFFGVLFRFCGLGLISEGMEFEGLLLSIARGFTLASQTKIMINSFKFEEQMDRPINEIREELGLPTKENITLKFIEPLFYGF
tara:strand:+ start:548 stop:1294 length:747 start_codon:yes stop_codon:yes gene_type:complete